ncbi:MAG: dUTP diphosphatase [Planctomycetota bacterium]|nr:MAG: dUTP diphosphatase [Planctomycetota bacterium]
MKKILVKIHRMPDTKDVPLPAYQSQDAVGMDLHAAVPADVTIEPGAVSAIPCGFAMALPSGYEAQVRPRSGLAAKNGISLVNTPGTIDPDYRGEVKVLLINHGKEPFRVTRGMRVAQMVVMPVPRVEWMQVDKLPETKRGAGGFGHTGH